MIRIYKIECDNLKTEISFDLGEIKDCRVTMYVGNCLDTDTIKNYIYNEVLKVATYCKYSKDKQSILIDKNDSSL